MTRRAPIFPYVYGGGNPYVKRPRAANTTKTANIAFTCYSVLADTDALAAMARWC